ncbi:DUF6516 family protein [Bdellovibrionota bacterium FG-1]
MSPKLERTLLTDGSYIDVAIDRIKPDQWRSHGIRYRLAWIKNGKCRVLFDNHHGKQDHFHVEDEEFPYHFVTEEQLAKDFAEEIKKLGGPE